MCPKEDEEGDVAPRASMVNMYEKDLDNKPYWALGDFSTGGQRSHGSTSRHLDVGCPHMVGCVSREIYPARVA